MSKPSDNAPKKCPVTHLTTDFGAPVPDNQNSLTAGPRGPLLSQDVWLHEKLGNFVREVIPERRMHAKGSGAFGTFTVTNDITRYTRAAIFSASGRFAFPAKILMWFSIAFVSWACSSSGAMVARLGFEPRLWPPKGRVLPLHHRAMRSMAFLGCAPAPLGAAPGRDKEPTGSATEADPY